MTAHDTRLSLAAERRSTPATPEVSLTDAVEWMTRDGLVPAEHITGLVWQGEVYDMTPTQRWSVCVLTAGHQGKCRPGRGHYSQKHYAAHAGDRARGLYAVCGRVLSRIVAGTAWEVAR